MTINPHTRWRNLKRQPGAAFFSLIGLLALLSGLMSHLAYAVPMMTTYQGHLADAGGNPLNVTVRMTFALYATPTGGTPLWTETHPNVTITQGVFSVVLGSVVNFEPDDIEGQRYLGMAVEEDAEMMPRELLTSAAFAIRAGIAESVIDGAVSTDKLAASAVTTDKVADDAVTGAKIADLDGHSATALDDISSAGSGAIVTTDERDRWNALRNGAFQLNGNDAYYNDGNVGIGTTTPTAKLEVLSRMKLNGQENDLFGIDLEGVDNAGTKRDWTLYHMNDYGNRHNFEIWQYIDGDGDGAYCDSDGGQCTHRFTIAENGNVGIGTVAPTAKLDVNGSIRGQGFFHANKEGVDYQATPLDCVDICTSLGGRMATLAEMYAHASSKTNICAWMWVLDNNNIGKVARGYPMYKNRTSVNCGRLNTGDVPRIEGLYANLEWTDTGKYDCGCYGIR